MVFISSANDYDALPAATKEKVIRWYRRPILNYNESCNQRERHRISTIARVNMRTLIVQHLGFLQYPSFSANHSHRSLHFLLHDWLHGFPGLFTDASEHIRFLFFTFSRLSWLVSAFDCTLKQHLVSYRIVSYPADFTTTRHRYRDCQFRNLLFVGHCWNEPYRTLKCCH